MKDKLLHLLRRNPMLPGSLLGVALILLAKTHPLTLLIVSLWSPTALFDIGSRLLSSRRLTSGKLFGSGFIIVFLVRQLFAKDALVLPGAFYHPVLNQFGGGPLGEPSFESIAIGSIGGLCFLQVAGTLRSLDFSLGHMIRLAVITTVWGMVIWGFWIGVYYFGEQWGFISKGSHIISKAVFHLNFDNPHRILIVPPIAAVYVVVVVLLLRKCFTSGGSHEVAT